MNDFVGGSDSRPRWTGGSEWVCQEMRPKAPPSKSPHPPREVEATEGPRPWLVKWDLPCHRVQMESLAQTQQLGIAGLAQARPRKRELQFLKHTVVTVRGCVKGIMTSKARKQEWWPKKRFCRMYLYHYFTRGRWSAAFWPEDGTQSLITAAWWSL